MAHADAHVAELLREISRLRELVLDTQPPPEIVVPESRKLPRSFRHRSTRPTRYLLAVLWVSAAWATTVALKDSVHAAYFQTPFFFCAITLSSWFGGFGAGMCSTVLSLILLGVFFPEPHSSGGFPMSEIPRFTVFLLAGGFISWLGGRQRRDEESLLRAREELEEKVRARTLDLQGANERLRTEIADRVRQKALAEARTESVMRANKTIPASLSTLDDTHDLDRLLGEVLLVIVEYLREEGGGVWLYDEDADRLRMHLVLEDGAIKPADASTHPAATPAEKDAISIRKGAHSARMLPLFKNNIAEILRAEDLATQPWLASYRDYFSQRGVHALVSIPLLAGDEFLGLISVRCRLDDSLAPGEIAFIQAIANHASLALKMSHLAEVENRAVVLEERRESISRNKESLERIANAGRATLQRLAEHPDLNTFLDHVLAVSVEQFGAIGASVWLGDPLTGICGQYISYTSGDHQAATKPAYEHHFELASSLETDALRPIHGRIIIHNEKDFEALSIYRDHLANLRELGIRTLLRIPLFFGSEARGIFTLKFTADRTLTPEEDGLAHTLANQVVLALEITKLSEKAKTAALADERNRMAADVHDTLAQAFAATLLHLRSMDMRESAPELQSHWRFAQDTAAEGLTAARRAMNAVRTAPPANARPLPERLAERVRQIAARAASNTKVRFQLDGEPSALPWAVEDEFERLANEALFNAERHSAAGEISVNLDYLPEDGLCLRVRDNGRGFDQAQPAGSGLGLRSMHDRAERIGASFTLITESGRGTEIVVLWMRGDVPHAPRIAHSSMMPA